MKISNYFIIYILFLFQTYLLLGQNSYNEALDSARYYVKKEKIGKALKFYFAAEAFDETKKDSIKIYVEDAFLKIEKLKIEAENAKDSATARATREYKAKQQAKLETEKAQSLTLALLANEQYGKGNKTIALRLAELASKKAKAKYFDKLQSRILKEVYENITLEENLVFHHKLSLSDEIIHMRLSPKGKLIAASSEWNEIKIWNTDTGEEIVTLSNSYNWNNKAILDMDFTKNGSEFVVILDDTTIKKWNTSNWKSSPKDYQLSKIETEEIVNRQYFGELSRAYISSKKDFVLLNWDNRMEVWDLNSNSLKFSTWASSEFWADNSFRLTKDGNTLLSYFEKENIIKLWDVNKNIELEAIKLTSYDYVTDIEISSNGSYFYCVYGDGSANIWKKNKQGIFVLQSDDSLPPIADVSEFIFLDDDKQIVELMGNRLSIKILNLEQKTSHSMSPPLGVITSIQNIDDEKVFLGVGNDFIFLRDTETDKDKWRITNYDLSNYNRFDQEIPINNELLVTPTAEGKNLLIWKTKLLKNKFLLDTRVKEGNFDDIFDFIVSSDEKYIVTSNNKRLKVWSYQTGELLHDNIYPVKKEDLILVQFFSQNNKFLYSASAGGEFAKWNVITGENVWRAQLDIPIYCAEISDDGNSIIVPSGRNEISFISTANGGIDKKIIIKNIDIFSLEKSPNKMHNLFLNDDILIDIEEKITVKSFNYDLDDSLLKDVAFSNSGKNVLAFYEDGTLINYNILKDYENKIYLKELQGMEKIKCSSDDILLLYSDNKLNLLDLKTSKIIFAFDPRENFDGFIKHAKFSNDESYLILALSNGVIIKVHYSTETIYDSISENKEIYKLKQKDLDQLEARFINLKINDN